MPGRPARSGVDAGRAAAVLLLVVLAAVGLRAGGAFSAAGSGTVLSKSGHVLYWALVVVELLLAVAGVVLFVARLIWLRSGGAGRGARKRRSIWWILLLPFGVFGLSHVITALRKHGITAHETSGAAGLGAGAHGGTHHAPGSSWQVLVVFAVVVLIAGVVGAYRRRQHAGPPLEELDLAPDSEPLAEALAAGAQALREDPDPRAAIIGCYAAMERSLADAGSPAHAADTPAEVLARATEGGLVRSTWASTLTGLFRQARYSSHPMTEADRTTAMGALAQVRADLGSPA
jgi:Domain of unknown function (DUF4129)